jgi:RimJ/RimL family protein N-acetyltransferase
VNDPWPLRTPVTGDGLVLRPLTRDDRPVLPALLHDPDVARYTPIESPFDDAAAGRYLDRVLGQVDRGEAVHLAVLDGARPVGEVMAFHPRHPAAGAEDPPGTFELGYVVGPAHRGRGVGTRAVRLLGDALVADLGARRLVLRIDDGNVASERLAAACGYRFTGAVADGLTRVWEQVVA